MNKRISKIKEKPKITDFLNFRDIKEFLNEIATALVAFSIFLTVLMNIFEANYLKESYINHQITIFLLFFIIILLGFFIMGYSSRYKNIIVKFLGVSIFAFPVFFITFLSDNLQQNIIRGGYTLLMFASIALSAFIINVLLSILQARKFKESKLFIWVCFILSIILFLVVKFTNFVGFITKCIFKIIPFSYLPDILQILFLGFEIGFFIGLVLAPMFAFIRKIFPNNP